jgi:hypothetical protein
MKTVLAYNRWDPTSEQVLYSSFVSSVHIASDTRALHCIALHCIALHCIALLNALSNDVTSHNNNNNNIHSIASHFYNSSGAAARFKSNLGVSVTASCPAAHPANSVTDPSSPDICNVTGSA